MRLACAVMVLAVVANTGGTDALSRSVADNAMGVALPVRVHNSDVLISYAWADRPTAGRSASEARPFGIRVFGLASDGPATVAPQPSSPVATATAEPATPTPEPTRDAPVFGAAIEQWRSLVASIFPAWAVNTALRIMDCESKGDPNAIGAQGELGLFQIMPYWHPDATLDPTGNVLAAYRISNGGRDWSAWSCR